jgi:hypothetical protein
VLPLPGGQPPGAPAGWGGGVEGGGAGGREGGLWERVWVGGLKGAWLRGWRGKVEKVVLLLPVCSWVPSVVGGLEAEVTLRTLGSVWLQLAAGRPPT